MTTLALLVATAAVLAPAPASAAAPRPDLVFGASAHSAQQVLDNEAELGHSVDGVRTYKRWDGNLFGSNERWMRDNGHTLFMSIDAERRDGSIILFDDIADARPGDPLYQDMVAQATAVKEFGVPMHLTFAHEPETEWSWVNGDAASFGRAWRRLVDIYRAQGVDNVTWAFTTTAYAYRRTDALQAANYYPGDAWVDEIAADAYNFNGCRDIGRTDKWVPLETILEPHRQFGLEHPDKALVVLEFGSVEDPLVPGRKAEWIDDARALLKGPAYRQYTAALYWTGRNQVREHCPFDYASSWSAQAALGEMAADPAYAG